MPIGRCCDTGTYTARGHKLRCLLLQARVRAGVDPDRPRGRARWAQPQIVPAPGI